MPTKRAVSSKLTALSSILFGKINFLIGVKIAYLLGLQGRFYIGPVAFTRSIGISDRPIM